MNLFNQHVADILDHKLAREQLELPSLYRYLLSESKSMITIIDRFTSLAGEEIYCARKPNACGATIPLRKYYNLADSGEDKDEQLRNIFKYL